jgi:hypothetical protein
MSAAIVVLVALVLLYVTNTATAKYARDDGLRAAQRIVSTHAHRAARRTFDARRRESTIEAELERAVTRVARRRDGAAPPGAKGGVMANRALRAKWKAAGRCGTCGEKPAPGRKCCQACLDKQAKRDAVRRAVPRVGKWKPGGPGRPPVWARVKGGAAMEPQCQPETGPMRAEHEWKADGTCAHCKAPRPAGFVPLAAPEDPPAPRQPIIPSAADSLKRSPGPRGTVAPLTREQKLRFQGGMMAPVPARPASLTPADAPTFVPAEREPEAVPEGFGALPLDVVTFPDPIAAVIAQLELELVETELVLDVLRRIHTRRKTA